MSSHSPVTGRSNYLRATLWIRPNPEAGCGVVQLDEGPDRVTQNLVNSGREPLETNQDCCAEVTVPGGGQNQFLKRRTDATCICPVFSEHDCVASIDGVENGEFVVSLSVPDRDELVAIVESLRERGATPRLSRIAASSTEDGSRRLELEADAITDKQREALEMAVEAGYYETPRRADLGDLADELDVSRSAVSQRLTAVESKLISELFEVQTGLCEPN